MNVSYELTARMALEKIGFRFQKSLGQNFLLNEDLLNGFLDLAGVGEGSRILEIGPGAGVMTRLMLDRGASVTALELDRRLEPVLREVAGEALNVIFEDALKAPIDEIMGNEPYDVMANLPYYITTDFLYRIYGLKNPPETVTLLVQKEAAERIMAEMGTKTYCQLSACTAWFGAAEVLREVPPHLFTPPPNVQSALIRITRHSEKPISVKDEALFLKLIDAAFRMRRKTMLNNLVSAFSMPRDAAVKALTDAELDEKIRGEALTLGQFASLADSMNEKT